tara:strand:+ start:289 stop:687 length:399 start_codon:yes stop_codon:yes gene_type:complete
MSNCQRQRGSMICGFKGEILINHYRHINEKITNYEKDNSVSYPSHRDSDSDSDSDCVSDCDVSSHSHTDVPVSSDVVNLSGAKISSRNFQNTVEAGYFGHPGKFTAPIGWKPANRSVIKRKMQMLADIANSR